MIFRLSFAALLLAVHRSVQRYFRKNVIREAFRKKIASEEKEGGSQKTFLMNAFAISPLSFLKASLLFNIYLH